MYYRQLFTLVLIFGSSFFCFTETKNDFHMEIQEGYPGITLNHLFERICYSPDERYFATLNAHGTIKIWDERGILLRTMRKNMGSTSAIYFSPDGNYLIVRDIYWAFEIWDLTGRKLGTIPRHGGHQVWFSRNGSRLICGVKYLNTSEYTKLRIWYIPDGKLLMDVKPEKGRIYCFDVSADGERIIASGGDSKIYEWRTDTGRPVRSFLTGKEYSILRVAPDNKKIAVKENKNSNLSIIDLESGSEKPFILPGPHTVYKLEFSADSKFLLAFSSDLENGKNFFIDIYRTGDGGPVAHISDPAPYQGDNLQFSSDGLFAVYRTKSNALKIVTFPDCNVIRTIESPEGFYPDFHITGKGDAVTSVLRVPLFPKSLLTRRYDLGNMIKQYRLRDGVEIRSVKIPEEEIKDVSFFPGKDCIVFATRNGWIKTLDMKEEDSSDTSPFIDYAYNVVFSNNERYMACSFPGPSLIVWDLHKLCVVYTDPGSYFKSCIFSRDNNYFFIAIRDSKGAYIEVRRTSDWSQEKILQISNRYAAQSLDEIYISPDNKYLVGKGMRDIYIWEMSEFNLVSTFKHPGIIQSVDFTWPDLLVTTGVKSKQDVHRIAWFWHIPDGNLFASVSLYHFFPYGKNGKLWDLSDDGKYLVHADTREDLISPTKRVIIKKVTEQGINSVFTHEFKHDIECLDLSPGGDVLACGVWHSVEIIGINGVVPSGSYIEEGLVLDIRLSPDAKYTASFYIVFPENAGVSPYYNVSIRNTGDGKLVKTIDHLCDYKSSNMYSWVIRFTDNNTFHIQIYDNDERSVLLTRVSIKKDEVKTRVIESPGHFSPGGTYFAAYKESLGVQLTTLRTMDTVTFLSNENEWIVYTRDGYFDSTTKGGRFVYMIKDLEPFGVDQFAIRNNRPDIILEQLGFGQLVQTANFYYQYQKRLRQLGLKEKDLSREFLVPEVIIHETKKTGKYLSIRFTLRAQKNNLVTYNIYVNDVPVFGIHGKKASGMKADITEMIELSEGKNKIEVTCMDSGGAESYRAMTHTIYNGEVKKDLYFLGFGISEYKDPRLNLKYAAKDAEDLGRVFNQYGGTYNSVHSHVFLDEKATQQSIKAACGLLKDAGVDDTLILFIAGHGIRDTGPGQTYYFLTHESDFERLSETATPFDIFEELLEKAVPRKKLFLMDTCESGDVDEASVISFTDNTGEIRARTSRALIISLKEKQKSGQSALFAGRTNRYIYNNLIRRSGAIVLSSSRGNEFSYEKDAYENGLFTEAVISSLTAAGDRNKDSFISIYEFEQYVIEKVPVLSKDRQHPVIDRDNIYLELFFPILR